MDAMELLKQLQEQRTALEAEITAVFETAKTETRSASADELTAVAEKRAAIKALDERVIEVAEQEIRAREAAGAIGRLGGQVGEVHVRREPMTYERHNRGQSYFRDLGLAFVGGDEEARGRLRSHRTEMDVELPKLEARRDAVFQKALDELAIGEQRSSVERRDITRTDGAGGEFVPPLWIVEEYGEFARAGRPFADRVRRIPLPAGTDSINVPRITTGTAVAAQTADNAAVQETDMVTNSASGPVRTIAGQQDIALQLLEQSPIMFDELVFADLTADYNAKLDLQLINGTGANGQHTGVLVLAGTNAVTYTDASPTVSELFPKGADAVQQVATNRKLPPNAVVMHPRRWFWMTAALDANGRPLVVPIANGAYMAQGVANDVLAEGPVGFWHGLPVYLDANMPITLGAGTEDAIVAARHQDLLLFEGSVRTRALPEVLSGNLTVRLQAYAYSSFIPGRQPAAISKITGTGLIAPTF
jgi:HK97 family phage major capsid protein